MKNDAHFPNHHFSFAGRGEGEERGSKVRGPNREDDLNSRGNNFILMKKKKLLNKLSH